MRLQQRHVALARGFLPIHEPVLGAHHCGQAPGGDCPLRRRLAGAWRRARGVRWLSASETAASLPALLWDLLGTLGGS